MTNAKYFEDAPVVFKTRNMEKKMTDVPGRLHSVFTEME